MVVPDPLEALYYFYFLLMNSNCSLDVNLILYKQFNQRDINAK